MLIKMPVKTTVGKHCGTAREADLWYASTLYHGASSLPLTGPLPPVQLPGKVVDDGSTSGTMPH